MKRALIAPVVLLVTSMFPVSAAAQQPGLVRGTVLDEKGSPVAGAIASVEPLGVVLSKAVPEAETDKNGHFVIGHLRFGNYGVFAKKESADYPDISSAFYSNQVFSTVTLTASAPSADVVLRVGPPAGVLHGSVKDASTNAPVNAAVMLRRVAAPGLWISMSQPSEYRVLIPPSTEVLVEVSAPGYKTYYYAGPSDPLKRRPLRLGSGQEVKLDIQLERDQDGH